MKKILVVLSFIILSLYLIFSLKSNIIYGADISAADKSLNINLFSDYEEKVEAIRENNESVYFDVANARLSDDFKINASGFSVMTQQIGSKVRIYVKGGNFENLNTVFKAKTNGMPFGKSKTAANAVIFLFMVYLARKAYSDTIKIAKGKSASDKIKTAVNLNRRLYNMDKKAPVIVSANNMTNVITKKSDIVDFQYAKDKKNIKIAI